MTLSHSFGGYDWNIALSETMLKWSRDVEVKSQLHWNHWFAIAVTEPGFYPYYLVVGLRTSLVPQVKCLQRSPGKRLRSFVPSHICKNLLNACTCRVSPRYRPGNQLTGSLPFSRILMSSSFSLFCVLSNLVFLSPETLASTCCFGICFHLHGSIGWQLGIMLRKANLKFLRLRKKSKT